MMTARPTLMLFVGARGIRVADTCAALAPLAEVVLVTSDRIVSRRADRLADAAETVRDIVVVPTTGEILTRAREYARAKPVDGALTFSDDLVEVTAAFAAEHGLPGLGGPAAMVCYRDKFAQRRALAAAGVPVPPFHLLREPADVDAALAAVPLPAILKPTRGSGGALAFVISRPEELEPVLRESLSGVADAGAAVESGTEFLLEGLLVGDNWHGTTDFAPYVSVESIGGRGEIAHLAVTDRFPVAPPALETGMVLPSSLPAGRRAEVVDAADKALRALGFDTGLAHTELMLTADGPRVIEVNARAGGALPYLFPLVSSVDLTREAGRVALGLPPRREAEFGGYGVFVAPQHPVGARVRRVDGLAAAARVPGVRAVIPLAAEPGHTVDFRQTMIAVVLGVAATAPDAARLWREVMDTIRPQYREANMPDHYHRTPMRGIAGAC
ncbi:ATP-grasp domain-containing protein [Nocardia arthritidis]|uniref:ATP-grasp domain-containing protein n=1 Tax=Nocardia arthritidis TaxID=228602 RepID=A0A6G9YEP7_9NOCA|nr:ATP-grasp domain-containing protein [Nocardia arthritidis]QIS11600.1 ATP-grasp domain-containing protein [Nocardia arthritidis]